MKAKYSRELRVILKTVKQVKKMGFCTNVTPWDCKDVTKVSISISQTGPVKVSRKKIAVFMNTLVIKKFVDTLKRNEVKFKN